MRKQITNYLNRYLEFDPIEVDELYSQLKKEVYEKRNYLLKEGQICHKKYFLVNGLVRQFYTDEKGYEIITQFAIENWWLTNMESFTLQTPSKLNIQALEKTMVLSIEKKDLENIYVSKPKFERLFRIITENMLIAIQRKYEFYMKLNSEERYNLLVNSIPDLVQRVPQYMIASYLKISPEHLSTLRKKA